MKHGPAWAISAKQELGPNRLSRIWVGLPLMTLLCQHLQPHPSCLKGLSRPSSAQSTIRYAPIQWWGQDKTQDNMIRDRSVRAIDQIRAAFHHRALVQFPVLCNEGRRGDHDDGSRQFPFENPIAKPGFIASKQLDCRQALSRCKEPLTHSMMILTLISGEVCRYGACSRNGEA